VRQLRGPHLSSCYEVQETLISTSWRMRLHDGVVVLSGTVAHTMGALYFGFSGGGFDTIWLRDRMTNDRGVSP
jgi:hypothetical protein